MKWKHINSLLQGYNDMVPFWKQKAYNLFVGDLAPPKGALGEIVKKHQTEIVFCHPTFKNENNIGKLLQKGIHNASRVFPETRVAFVVSDGTCTYENRDMSTIDAAISGARELFREVQYDNILVVVTPYEGYLGNFTPGKGSALKLVYEELAFTDAKILILLDGDLRNDMYKWHRAFRMIIEDHFQKRHEKELFVTAHYARHFVDASLTRFVVGPLTTLMGVFVPGGISGDICLSAGAVALERDEWSEERRKYGTDISTTFNNLANPDTVIYEVYLGAKLHDITDEAKLTVMPVEVIGAALERILHYEKKIKKILNSTVSLQRPIVWGTDKTGIGFINPGFTDAFRIEAKVSSLINKWDEFSEDIEKVLGKQSTEKLAEEVEKLRNLFPGEKESIRFLNFTEEKWIDALYRGIALVFKEGNIQVVKRAFNYLYTAVFLEFCARKLRDLGLYTFEDVLRVQDKLGVPDERAKEFYEEKVDKETFKLAKDFFEGRRKILEFIFNV